MRWWKVLAWAFVIGTVGWMGWLVTRPVPGRRMEDQGREHVTAQQVAAFAYNSNPPTSGPHLPTWVKAGIYDAPQSDGELIHSLEHGYVIISYTCAVHLKSQTFNVKSQKVYAHDEEESIPSAGIVDPTMATGSAVNESDGCKTLVKNLTDLANRKKLWKLVVVPRPSLTTTIALTAWHYIDTFDQFDAGRIERFIDFHRGQGPEKTME